MGLEERAGTEVSVTEHGRAAMATFYPTEEGSDVLFTIGHGTPAMEMVEHGEKGRRRDDLLKRFLIRDTLLSGDGCDFASGEVYSCTF